VELDVRIQASDVDDLTAWQVVIMFDYSLVRVAKDSDCVQGPDWGSAWECTTKATR